MLIWRNTVWRKGKKKEELDNEGIYYRSEFMGGLVIGVLIKNSMMESELYFLDLSSRLKLAIRNIVSNNKVD